MNIRNYACLLTCFFVANCGFAVAQEHAEHGNATFKKTEPPKVYLDKSVKVVEYQLKRLSNAQLLSIDVATDHPKYAAVYAAIAARPGMSADQCETAVQALAKLSDKSTAETVFGLLGKLDESDREQNRVASALTDLLLQQAADQLPIDKLTSAAANTSPFVCLAAMAALINSDNTNVAQELVASHGASRVGLLAAIVIVPDETKRIPWRAYVAESLAASFPTDVRRQAALSLLSVGGEPNENVSMLAQLLTEPDMEQASVHSLLKINPAKIEPALAQRVATHLVTKAEATPAAKRTTDPFIDAAQLVDRLLPRLPEQESRSMRKTMQEIAVRVVRIKTVAEEMRYDLKHFVAAAGKPIQLILQNEDLMPHNLVIVQPGMLKEVALRAATLAPDTMTDGKQYVPAVPEVLFATKMIQAGKQARLTFNAPAVPGEYPFVCTYPNHWLRMYGVLVVVNDVDAYMQNPIEPKDPIGNNRSFVKNWKLGDFAGKLENGLRGRSNEIGARIFTEATCQQCHMLGGKGGRVGPDLNKVFERNKEDAKAVLREVIDPSHKIEPKYASHSVLTLDGQVYSGVIVAEDEKTIALLSSPDQPKPTIIQRSEIDDMVQSPKSIMPAALMDQFTQDEIFELLAYIKVAGGPPSP